MRWLVSIAVVVACKSAPKLEVDPVSLADATAFAEKFVAAARPCDVDKLAPLFDQEAMAAKIDRSAKSDGPKLGETMAGGNQGAETICTQQAKAVEYKLLHVPIVDGEPRPMLRRLVQSPTSGNILVTYDELQLGTSRHDHQVRVIDIYAFFEGEWLSEQLGGFGESIAAASTGIGDAMVIVKTIRHARELQDAKQYVEALAVLDTLPAAVRQARLTQAMRIALAQTISMAAYQQALEEVARLFPNDPSIAMREIDGAILRADYAAALHNIDTVDASVGGDPFLETLRVGVYLKRAAPGDLDKASARADAVVKAEPALFKAWASRLDVTIARKQWPDAVATLDEIDRRFRITFDEDKLRALPGNYGEMLTTPEYAAWRASRSSPR